MAKARSKSKRPKTRKPSLLWVLIIPLVVVGILASVYTYSKLQPGSAFAACNVPAPTIATAYQQLLRNTTLNGRWYHGDSGQSVKLPNGKELWVFGDTVSGTVNPDKTQKWADHLVNNSGILIEKGCSTVLLGSNDSTGKPTAWVKPTGSFDMPNLKDYYWASTPFMDGRTLRMFLTHMYSDDKGFHVIGTDIASFDVSRSTPRLISLNRTPSSAAYDKGPTYGASVIQTGGYTYIYGNWYRGQTWVFGHEYYLARVPNGQVTNTSAWRYWDGTTWSNQQTAAVPVIPGTAGVGSGATVYAKNGGGYILVSKKYDVIGKDLVGWKASALTGPWAEIAPAVIAPIPDAIQQGDITYLGLAHKDTPLASGNLLVSWSLNSNEASFFGSPRYGIYLSEVPQP